jgi:hypothetical protein
MNAARAKQFRKSGQNYGSADVKQPHNEFLAPKESYGHFKLAVL